MLLQVIVAVLCGITAGVVTGLIPGIHINLVSIILLSFSPLLLQYTNSVVLCCFIVAMAVTHTFLDAIPSIFLGAPDSDQVLNVLPGHKLLLEGKGFEAVKLTVVGSLLCLVVAICLVPLMIPFVGFIYPVLKQYIGYILLAIVVFMVLKDKNKVKNLFLFLTAGILGIIVLNIPNLGNPLFPLLSGLFGTSMLVVSLTQKVNIPKQKIRETLKIPKKHIIQAIAGGSMAGTLTSFFPGLGPSQGAVLASQFFRKLGDHGFMILVGGLNTVNFILSLVTLLVIEKARNGAVIVIKELASIDASTLILFLGAVLVTGGVATFLAMRLTRVFSRLFDFVKYEELVQYVIMFIVILVFWFSSFLGLLVLATATFVGMLATELDVARNHSMGCLLLPVLLFFLL
ncbi:tripartite tricarboxylate transporter permease [Thermoproteota archaeon]